ncbi:MAG TPA: EF-hand domain-containing protein [Candidatus Wallbacteria bacterium]|nr:EF-hand domain-containing protein [Candidatus Wallbacteria bacterium]
MNSVNGASGFNALKMSELRDKMFSRIDSNGDDKIGKEEFIKFKAAGPGGGKSAEEIFNEIDADSDGAISRQEDEDAMKKMAREGKVNRPQTGRPQGSPPGGGAQGLPRSDESEDENLNGIPDDEETKDPRLILEEFLKEVMKKYTKNKEPEEIAGNEKKANGTSTLEKDLYA